MKKLFFIMGFMLAVNPVWAAQAKAVIKGTAPDSKISGEVTLTEENGGLTVTATVANLPPGKRVTRPQAIVQAKQALLATIRWSLIELPLRFSAYSN